MCFAWIHPLLFSVIYAAAAVHLCVSCMFISFMSEKLFMCTVTTIMICAISFLLSLHCNLQICRKSSLISTVSLTRPPSLSTSKSLSFRNISSKSYKPLTSNRSVSFRLQDSFCFWNLGFLKGDLFHVRLSVHLLNMNLYAASAACVYIWWQVIFLVSSFSFQLRNLFLRPSRWAHPLIGKRCTTMILGVNQFSGSNCCWITFVSFIYCESAT